MEGWGLVHRMVSASIVLLLWAVPSPWPWPHAPSSQTVADRIAPPPGYVRPPAPPGSFAAWLRALPVLAGDPAVQLFDGRKKRNQEAHAFVLDLDVGPKDLLQCADAVIRLRAEYLFAQGDKASICFHLTSGDPAPFGRWMRGERPQISQNRLRWVRGSTGTSDHAALARYLEFVFTYAGSASLAAELARPTSPIEAGDVIIRGGHPGHAIIVLDVAEKDGRRAVLLAQSYMPAQQIHVLRNPKDQGSPWYVAETEGALETPEWRFEWQDRRRFTQRTCGSAGGGLL